MDGRVQQRLESSLYHIHDIPSDTYVGPMDDYHVGTVVNGLLTFNSGLTIQIFFSLHFSPTSLTFASIAFFFTLYLRKSWYMLSTRKVMLPVATEAIRAKR